MIRLNYTFRAMSPIHTGSDVNLGTLRQLRRETVRVNVPRKVRSRFLPEQKRLKRQAIALLLLRLWDKMPMRGRTTIYEELASKLLASTAVRSKEEFLQAICHKLEIREITTSKDRRFDVVDILELFDDYELLQLIRGESQYILTFFRKLKDDNIFWMKEHGKGKVARNTVFVGMEMAMEHKSPEVVIMDALEAVLDQDFREEELASSIEHIPFISGNSIRGQLRRAVMYDFCRIVGITRLTPQHYHMLFTGGTLSDGTGFEDMDYRNELIANCPMIGLFGAAAGKQTITGELRVSKAELLCMEYGTGPDSYHDLVGIDFGTRHDSAKSEAAIEIVGEDKDTHQMIYQQEVFVTGAEFSHGFACTSNDELILSAFLRMIQLFYEDPVITAKGSIGYGEIDLENLFQESCSMVCGDQNRYLSYLYENKDRILEYWQVKN